MDCLHVVPTYLSDINPCNEPFPFNSTAFDNYYYLTNSLIESTAQTFLLMSVTLKGLSAQSSKASSLVRTNRSKGAFCFASFIMALGAGRLDIREGGGNVFTLSIPIYLPDSKNVFWLLPMKRRLFVKNVFWILERNVQKIQNCSVCLLQYSTANLNYGICRRVLFCRSRQALSNESWVVAIGVDTNDNEPSQVWRICFPTPYPVKFHFLGKNSLANRKKNASNRDE